MSDDTCNPLQQPDLDNSARVKELEAEVERLQAERHEMGRRMRELIMNAWREGHLSIRDMTSEQRMEMYADRIMKGEGNG